MAHSNKDITLPFQALPNTRASFRSGTIYAIDGGDSYIYYGQIAADESIGFFKHRSKKLSSITEVVSAPFMSRFYVACIGEALRLGKWLRLGSCALRKELDEPRLLVQWSVGELEVSIWKENSVVRKTMVNDPEVQNLEIMAVSSAIYHAPKRLQADFVGGFESWPVGGPIWRERIKKEEMARDHPEKSWHTLPGNWVYVDRAAYGG